ncbi:hypothetical protein CK203_092408 [Vitis vinifera]|uniref:Reverse transcriptase zinc-binding domain-containing protein n=1 Tax=Vitis vinifera TaxID=29760 RepID=A0A438F0K3_VITVI|nr:hypothetical protein CK203_092408 [Vitis vinifera]
MALLGKWLWRLLLNSSGILHSYSFLVGNGAKIHYWEDFWWAELPLSSQFPNLYRVVSVRNSSIASILGLSSPFGWNF